MQTINVIFILENEILYTPTGKIALEFCDLMEKRGVNVHGGEIIRDDKNQT